MKALSSEINFSALAAAKMKALSAQIIAAA
jgi:hypothetical protein